MQNSGIVGELGITPEVTLLEVENIREMLKDFHEIGSDDKPTGQYRMKYRGLCTILERLLDDLEGRLRCES
jgi:hypothetical protein